GDQVKAVPEHFQVTASTSNSPIAAFASDNIAGIQFHPEVVHTPQGTEIIRNFLTRIAHCLPNWTPASFIEQATADIREKMGDSRVLLALSGGVDSSVAAALIHRAIGDQLTPVFVNNGLLRQGE